MAWQIGVDVGGTFTDLLALDPQHGVFRVAKVPSTPEDQSVGFMAGLSVLETDLAAVAALVHGTTVATNAVLERKGARCGLITTAGFRDVLELGRRTRPNPLRYDRELRGARSARSAGRGARAHRRRGPGPHAARRGGGAAGSAVDCASAAPKHWSFISSIPTPTRRMSSAARKLRGSSGPTGT